jgi:hypothetical protein
MRLVAGLFILVHALAALAMVAFSAHGPTWLAPSAGVYFALVVALVLWASARHSWRFLVGVGMAMLAAPPALFLVLDKLDRVRYEQRIAATRVSEVRDEPILSDAGRPIGMRLSFTVTVPRSSSYAISPSAYGTEGFYMDAMQRTLDGRPDAWQYVGGRAHRQTAELYPPILMRAADGTRCLSHSVPSLPAGSEAAPLRIVIHETPFAGRTNRVYNLPQLYRNVIAEGLRPCEASL